jgi:hypothetical protein
MAINREFLGIWTVGRAMARAEKKYATPDEIGQGNHCEHKLKCRPSASDSSNQIIRKYELDQPKGKVEDKGFVPYGKGQKSSDDDNSGRQGGDHERRTLFRLQTNCSSSCRSDRNASVIQRQDIIVHHTFRESECEGVVCGEVNPVVSDENSRTIVNASMASRLTSWRAPSK